MQEIDWFWLSMLPGFYRNHLSQLLQVYGNPSEIRKAADKEIIRLDFLSEAQKRRFRKQQEHFDAETEYDRLSKKGIHFFSCRNIAYPEKLLQTPDYPYGLYVIGKLPDKEERCVGIVGARACSRYGDKMARELAQRLGELRVSVVSGMARGVDGIAQQGCLDAGWNSYGILGCGVDICYPRENEYLYERLAREGGLISEFPPGTSGLPYHFPLRNRIISGLSDFLVVVEARKKSGTLITTDYALEQGKDVYAFPGRTDDPLSEGCNSLISQGAGIITDVEEFLEKTGLLETAVQKEKKAEVSDDGKAELLKSLSETERIVYACLESREKPMQEIAADSGLSVICAIRTVGKLEIAGLIKEVSKNHYVRV